MEYFSGIVMKVYLLLLPLSVSQNERISPFLLKT